MRILVLLALVLGLAGFVVADDATTVQGTVMCAKCTLKQADATKCQNVLVVADKDGKETHYYIAKNDVADKLGEVCTGRKPVTITGVVAEKDGRRWITASKIEEAKS